MTFGFQQGAVPAGRNREAVSICLVIGPTVESLIYSIPSAEILWNHPDTQRMLIASLSKTLQEDHGYQSNAGGIRKQ